ncbi:MAG: CapA family protein [Polaribacter sp.]
MNKYNFLKPLIILLTLFVSFGMNKIQAQETTPKEISLQFIGDFMGHKDQINAAYNSATKTYDYNECFKYVTPMLSKADFTIANLEVTLGIKPYSGYPQFSSPPEYASAIKAAGVDVLMTANNHSCDKHKRGIESTIKILDSLQIKHTGTFINKEVKKTTSPLIIKKNGIKLAIINYTYGTNGILPTPPNVVNYLDTEVIKKDIEAAKLLEPDEIIAFVHWGTQYKEIPSNSQKYWYNYFKSLGVRIVIGAHPHVLQPMILDKKSNGIVVYSLGNFISHQRTFPRDGGAVFNLILEKKGKKVTIKNASYQLTWVHESFVNKQKKYFVLPVVSFENDSVFLKKREYAKMMRFTKHTRKLLEKENKEIFELKE